MPQGSTSAAATYRLLHELQAANALSLLRDLVASGLHLYGGSADAAVLGTTIATISHIDADYIGLTDLTGAAVVEAAVWVHYAAGDRPLIEQFLREWGGLVVAMRRPVGRSSTVTPCGATGPRRCGCSLGRRLWRCRARIRSALTCRVMAGGLVLTPRHLLPSGDALPSRGAAKASGDHVFLARRPRARKRPELAPAGATTEASRCGRRCDRQVRDCGTDEPGRSRLCRAQRQL